MILYFFQTLTEWTIYLAKLDTLLEEAFKVCLNNSLNVIFEALHGDGTTAPSPLLLLEAELLDTKVFQLTLFFLTYFFLLRIFTICL